MVCCHMKRLVKEVDVMAKNYFYANKGMGLEDEIIKSNEGYKNRGIANVQKISTPWRVRWSEGQIVGAIPKEKSTLDFRGTIKPGISISFDCKESSEIRGLPLANITRDQIEYMNFAMKVHEITFIVCCIKPLNKRFVIPGEKVVKYWDRWRANKGKRGYNYIPVEEMTEIQPRNGIVLDYITGLMQCTDLKRLLKTYEIIK